MAQTAVAFASVVGAASYTKDSTMEFVAGLLCGLVLTPTIMLAYSAWVYTRNGDVLRDV